MLLVDSHLGLDVEGDLVELGLSQLQLGHEIVDGLAVSLGFVARVKHVDREAHSEGLGGLLGEADTDVPGGSDVDGGGALVDDFLEDFVICVSDLWKLGSREKALLGR